MMKIRIVLSAFMIGGVLVTAPGAQAASELKVSKKNCARVVRHMPAPDVAYKPGVDVRGRKVAPADAGGGSPIKLPKEISIDIGIDLEEKYGIGAGGKFTGEANIGKVTVKGGRAYFNGQPLGDGEQQAIAEACRKAYKK